MFETIFSQDWAETYSKELRELLEGPDGPDSGANEDSFLWCLLIAIDQILEGKISEVQYKHDHQDPDPSGEHDCVDFVRFPVVPVPDEDWEDLLDEDALSDEFSPLPRPEQLAFDLGLDRDEV